MAPRQSTRAQAAVLNAVLRVLGERGHVIQAVIVRPTGEIELRFSLDVAPRPAAPVDPLEQWRADRRANSRKS